MAIAKFENEGLVQSILWLVRRVLKSSNQKIKNDISHFA